MSAITTLDTPRRGLWSDAIRRMFRSPLTVVGMVIVGVLMLCAFFAPWIAPYGPYQGDFSTMSLMPPSPQHLFGTDYLGQDNLSRIIYGAQISLKIALLSEGFGMAIGIVIGLLTGYYGGLLDTVIMRFVDVFMAFPLLIVAIALVAALGQSENNIPFALSLVIWPFVARLVRSQVLSLREAEYVSAAKLIGVSDAGIMFRHILPNTLTPLVVYATLGIANVILQEAALSFLGLGNSDPNTPSWGRMLNSSRDYMLSEPLLPFFPGMVILLAVLGFNLLGDGLRDALDVRSR